MNSNDNPTDADAFAALNAALDVTEISWEPKPGDRLTGKLLDVEQAVAKSGEPYPILRLECQDGTVYRVAAGRTVLRRKLVAAKVQPGDLLGIQYDGEAESKNGRTFHDYRVAVQPVGERGSDVFAAAEPAADDLIPAAFAADGDAPPF